MQDKTTILLVEDALDLARLIQRELESEGYRVLHAVQGRQALSMQQARQPDLIILDWMLPGMDGLEVLRHIRQASPVPVLMLTARSQEIDRVLGLEVGADDYLTKPFSTRELIARVHALLRRIQNVRQILSADREQHNRVAIYGPLVMQPETHQARLDDRNVELTHTEFDLLYLLVQNPGRVFSRAYLLETVWGERYLSGDRSVDNMILRLRKKLGDLGDRIETVWGVGYRLKSKT
jgi:DNA-binding response OmpR family regulator